MFCYLTGIFQVDSIFAHADSKRLDRSLTPFGGNGADQRGIQTAAEQETDLGICHQPFFYPCDQLFTDVGAYSVQIVMADVFHFGQVTVADELPVLEVMTGREGHDLVGQIQKVFRFAGKENGAFFVITVVQRSDTNGVAGGDKTAGLRVVQNKSEFRVQHGEHLHAVFLIEGKQDLAV